jgi:Methylase involved in ubiquinone/menaquinone biosynthesis
VGVTLAGEVPVNVDEGADVTARQTSDYAKRHLAAWVPVHYDQVMYAADSYDTFIWKVQQPFLRATAASMASREGGLRYLDFACGTGRITSALEDLAGESVGLDISPDMLAAATVKAPRSRFRAGDILAEPDLATGPYDLITAIRFFVNTEGEMRRRVMPVLSALLAGRDSRLVFNVHMNALHFIPNYVYRRLHGWPGYRTMTYWQARRLAHEAGLEIVELYGFGLVPERLHRGRLARAARWVDRKTAGKTPFSLFCRDLVLVCRLRA